MDDLLLSQSADTGGVDLTPEQSTEPLTIHPGFMADRAGAFKASVLNTWNDAKDGAYHSLVKPMLTGNGFIKNPDLLKQIDDTSKAVSDGYRAKHINYDTSNMDEFSVHLTQAAGQMVGTVMSGGVNPLGVGAATYNMVTGQYHRELTSGEKPMGDEAAWNAAQKMALPETAVSMFMPGGARSSNIAMRFASRFATGFSWNAMLDPAEANWRHKVLTDAGRSDLAEKYGTWDAGTMFSAGLSGGLLNGFMGPREGLRDQFDSVADRARTANRWLNGQSDRIVNSAPGIPANAQAQSFHVNALQTAHEQALAGQPVDVSGVPGAAGAQFLPHPDYMGAHAPLLEVTPEVQKAAQDRLAVLDSIAPVLEKEVRDGQATLLRHLPGGDIHNAAENAASRILNRQQVKEQQSVLANTQRHLERLQSELDNAVNAPVVGSGADLSAARQAKADNVAAIRAALDDTHATRAQAEGLLADHQNARSAINELMPADRQAALMDRVMGGRQLLNDLRDERARQQQLANGIPDKPFEKRPGVFDIMNRVEKDTQDHAAKVQWEEPPITDEPHVTDRDPDVIRPEDSDRAMKAAMNGRLQESAAPDPVVEQSLRRLETLAEGHPDEAELRGEIAAIREEYAKNQSETSMYRTAVTCLLEGFE